MTLNKGKTKRSILAMLLGATLAVLAIAEGLPAGLDIIDGMGDFSGDGPDVYLGIEDGHVVAYEWDGAGTDARLVHDFGPEGDPYASEAAGDYLSDRRDEGYESYPGYVGP